MRKVFALGMLLAGSAVYVFAQTQSPEIDPSSGITALALLSGGLLVLRGRRKK
jgi:MYXO-CTERM domain-containing protein